MSHPALFELMAGIDTADEIRQIVRANLAQGVTSPTTPCGS